VSARRTRSAKPSHARVCRHVAEGRTDREVAQAVFITEKTVERHPSSV
jgi:DNA-binding NarL/FixJ family response regulator